MQLVQRTPQSHLPHLLVKVCCIFKLNGPPPPKHLTYKITHTRACRTAMPCVPMRSDLGGDLRNVALKVWRLENHWSESRVHTRLPYHTKLHGNCQCRMNSCIFNMHGSHLRGSHTAQKPYGCTRGKKNRHVQCSGQSAATAWIKSAVFCTARSCVEWFAARKNALRICEYSPSESP